jgi:hypothetical protein
LLVLLATFPSFFARLLEFGKGTKDKLSALSILANRFQVPNQLPNDFEEGWVGNRPPLLANLLLTFKLLDCRYSNTFL